MKPLKRTPPQAQHPATEQPAPPDILRALVLSTRHMAHEDDALLTVLSDDDNAVPGEPWHWITETGSGFVIRLTSGRESVQLLRDYGLSGALCFLLETVATDHDVTLIQFDTDGDTLPGWPLFICGRDDDGR